MRKRLEWCFGSKRYVFDVDPSESPYYRKCQMSRNIYFLPYYSTIDDPVTKEIADYIDSELPYDADDAYAANVVLAMVQQNIKYVSDEELYGVPDLWALPSNVLELGKGDCDCMTDLYVSVAYNLGIDVVSVIVFGHMFSAAHIDWDGVHYNLDGREYYHLEITSDRPFAGMVNEDFRVEAWAPPEVPSAEFLETLTESPGM